MLLSVSLDVIMTTNNTNETYIKCKLCKNPITEGSEVFCEKHLISNRERGVKDRQRRKEAGICRSCNKPLSPDSMTWCEVHHQRQNESSRQLAAKAREKELCIDCNEVPRLFRKQRCDTCQAIYDMAKNSKCKRNECDATRDTKYFCRLHADEENDKLRERRQKLKDDGKCIFCFKDLGNRETLCSNCLEKQKEQRHATAVGV